jgi:hypothetical protein
MPDWPSPEEIINSLMKGTTPERASEIDELWVGHHPKVVVALDKSSITVDAIKERIKFDPKMIDVFWLISFSGWKAIECYSPHIIFSEFCGKTLQERFADDGEFPTQSTVAAADDRVS